ncbi:hypothetical protein SCOR_18295 [Sulfidibacter corallicola]
MSDPRSHSLDIDRLEKGRPVGPVARRFTGAKPRIAYALGRGVSASNSRCRINKNQESNMLRFFWNQVFLTRISFSFFLQRWTLTS